MYNPVDQRTINAMVSYRMEHLRADLEASKQKPVLTSEYALYAEAGDVTRVRRSIGLSMIRLGARLAGIRMQARISNQY